MTPPVGCSLTLSKPCLLSGLRWSIVDHQAGNFCSEVVAELILGRPGQRSCVRLCDFRTRVRAAHTPLSSLRAGGVTTPPALILDARVLPRVQSVCSVMLLLRPHS